MTKIRFSVCVGALAMMLALPAVGEADDRDSLSDVSNIVNNNVEMAYRVFAGGDNKAGASDNPLDMASEFSIHLGPVFPLSLKLYRDINPIWFCSSHDVVIGRLIVYWINI